jgi:hypothetical protein
MEEDIVRQVFRMYLESVGKKVVVRRKTAAGPDFIVEGVAYECKGSRFDEKGLFDQILQYAFQFSRVGLVIPYDAITLKLIWKLKAMEYFIRESPALERSIEMFLVAETEDKKYAIYNFGSARYLDIEVDSILRDLISNFTSISSIEEKKERILEFLEDADVKIREEIKKFIICRAKEAKSVWKGGVFSLSVK